jgi:hypothetical protein
VKKLEVFIPTFLMFICFIFLGAETENLDFTLKCAGIGYAVFGLVAFVTREPKDSRSRFLQEPNRY